jgi:hypothetical protein
MTDYTKVADVIVPEVFNPYVIERTAELSALVQSGIIETSPELDKLASGGGRLISMPYWQDLAGEDELLSDAGDLTPAKIEAKQDQAVLLMRGRAWAATDLAKALSGDDPMGAIANLVADYWARRRQATLLAILQGVFAASDDSMEDNTHDISEADESTWTAETFIDASYCLGDAESKLTGVMVHSATLASLRKLDLIEFAPDSEGKPTIPTYMGKRVIVDDKAPVANKVYTSYLFGQGAIGLGNAMPPVATEVGRNQLGGVDYLINRQHFLLHPRGVAWTDEVVTQKTPKNPSNADLANGANWTRVYEAKNVRIVAFKHRLE